jgi:acyl carrier protein
MATPGAAERVAELQAASVRVSVFAGDVADRDALAAVLREIRSSGPPLRGVVHAAAEFGDGLAGGLVAAGIAPVLRAKLGGAVALDALTRDDPVELFLLFSSATSVLGAPGQGAYVAANLALEALARRRHAQGRPALAIAWGPIADVGILAERPEQRERLARRLGATPMPAQLALSYLPAALACGLPVVAIAETNWTATQGVLPILATPVFSEMRPVERAVADENLLERLAGCDRQQAAILLTTVVAEETARIMRLAPGSVDPQRPLPEIGMDSLMVVELRLALESRLRVELPLVSLIEGTSAASIAERLAEAVAARNPVDESVALAERYESAEAGHRRCPDG